MPQPFAEVRSVKLAVLARDGYRCIHCGVSNDRHKTTYGIRLGVRRLVPGSAYTVGGCETICRSCAARRSQAERKKRNKRKQ